MNRPTLEQFAAALTDYLPSAFLRQHAAQFEYCWEHGLTVAEAFAFAELFLRAPVITPRGWEHVQAGPAIDTLVGEELPGDGAPNGATDGLRRLLDDLRLDSEL